MNKKKKATDDDEKGEVRHDKRKRKTDRARFFPRARAGPGLLPPAARGRCSGLVRAAVYSDRRPPSTGACFDGVRASSSGALLEDFRFGDISERKINSCVVCSYPAITP